MEMAMGNNAKITFNMVKAVLALLWLCGLTSCSVFNSINYKRVSCGFDYTVKEKDKVLDLSQYELRKNYENDSCIVRVTNTFSYDYTKRIYDKKTGIEKVLCYDSNKKIRFAGFEYSVADIGFQYEFDEYGNITDSIDTDEGYTVCWAQALAIGKSYAKHKMHKTEPEIILDKGNEGTFVWHFLYTDKQGKRKELVIDGKTGKVIKEYRVEVIV